MRLDESLEAIKNSADGCHLVAFGDLQTCLVLRVAGEECPTQEGLNQICGQAGRAFKTLDALSNSEVNGRSTRDHALMVTPEAYHAFIRSSHNDCDVICCTCEDMRTADHLVEQSRTMLRLIAAEA